MTDTNRAAEQAAAHAETIEALYEVSQFCDGTMEGCEMSREAKSLLRELGFTGENQYDVDVALQERIQEYPLSVLVRGGWCCPGEQSEPEEFEIVLCTGGPAVRLRGYFNRYNEPRSATLEFQDWGTPWTESRAGDSDALLWFASCFYFGD